ncbi:MFS transporter [Halobacteria archaeon HArc-gm2]|nr:MFS transporter [Halobacteria archaeon HArc-gm2]
MADALQSTLRDRVDPGLLLHGIAYAGALYWQLRTSPTPLRDLIVIVAGVTVVVAIIVLASWLTETYDLQSALKSLAVGAVATTYGAALFVFGDIPPAVSVGLLVVGVWFLFDAVQVVRHDGLDADERGPPDRPGVPRDDVARNVDYALRDRPRTKRELCDELDLDVAAVDDALATLDERRVLTRQGSELRTSRTPVEEPGSVARIRREVRRGASRLARPVTVELQG